MEIKVCGPGCAKCQEAERIVSKAVTEAGIQAAVRKITDFKEMLAYGIMSTPAVIIDGKVLCTGRVPSLAEVKEWLGGNRA